MKKGGRCMFQRYKQCILHICPHLQASSSSHPLLRFPFMEPKAKYHTNFRSLRNGWPTRAPPPPTNDEDGLSGPRGNSGWGPRWLGRAKVKPRLYFDELGKGGRVHSACWGKGPQFPLGRGHMARLRICPLGNSGGAKGGQ